MRSSDRRVAGSGSVSGVRVREATSTAPLVLFTVLGTRVAAPLRRLFRCQPSQRNGPEPRQLVALSLTARIAFADRMDVLQLHLSLDFESRMRVASLLCCRAADA